MEVSSVQEISDAEKFAREKIRFVIEENYSARELTSQPQWKRRCS
jgi:hypothetical protein